MLESLSELRAFVRVVETSGFTPAARSLDLSTAMVSKHITALERRLGVRLLDRNTRRTTPTEAGSRFYERCVALLDDLAEAETEIVDTTREVSGTLRVSMPPEFAEAHLAPLLPAFAQRHPQLKLSLMLSSRVVDLVEEGLDAALRFMRRYDGALNGRQLGRTSIVAVAAPAYLQAHAAPASPDDLASHRAVAYGSPEPWRDFPWTHADGRRGVAQLKPWFVASSTDMVRRAAAQGLGVAISTTMDAGAELRSGELVRFLPDHDFGQMGVFVVYPHRRHLPAKVRAFVDFLVECFGDDPDADPFVDGLRSPRA